MVHAYYYGPYGAYKIRNSDKTCIFPVVVSYTEHTDCEHPRVVVERY